MASEESQEPESATERETQERYLFSPFIALLFILIVSLVVFALRHEQNPAKPQSENQNTTPTKRAKSKPTPAELVPIHSASPGGNSSLGGGTSLGGAAHH